MITLKNIAILGASLAALSAFAQQATPEQRAGYEQHGDKMGIFHANATIGSFKLINGRGRAEINFSGTILIHGYKPRVAGQNFTLTGALTKEYDDAKRERVMYHGNGKLVIDGEWKGIQFFGKNINMWFFGAGTFRNRGEFDKNLFCGDFWFENAAEKKPWASSATMDVQIPMIVQKVNNPNVVPKKRGG